MHVGSVSMHDIRGTWTIDAIMQCRDDGNITHEALESDGDLCSDDMLAGADRTPTSEA